MSKIPLFRKLSREDFPEAPEWFDRIYDVVNPFMDTVNNALIRRITLNNNINSEPITAQFEHGVEKTLTLRTISGQPTAMLIGSTSGVIVTGQAMRLLGTNQVAITLLFNGSPTDKKTISLWIVGNE